MPILLLFLLTPREAVDNQLNATALHMLHQAVPEEHHDYITLFNTTKEIWDCLAEMLEGDDHIHRLKLELLKQEVNMFMRNDDESPKALFQRLKSYVVALKRYGVQWADDEFIVSKFVGSMLPYDPTMVMMIQQRPDFNSVSPNDVVATFVTHDLMKKKSS